MPLCIRSQEALTTNCDVEWMNDNENISCVDVDASNNGEVNRGTLVSFAEGSNIPFIVGIFSSGSNHTPFVYLKVSAYLDWIESFVWPMEIKVKLAPIPTSVNDTNV